MKCKICGTLFSEGVFCPECGAKVGKSENIADMKDTAELEVMTSAVTIEQRKANIELKKQELEYENEKKRQEMELESERRKKKIELELERKRQQAKLDAEIKMAEEEHAEKKRIEAEKREEEKAAKKKAEQQAKAPYRRAVISIVLGVISLFTLGCFFIPEIVGMIFALKAKTDDGKLVHNAKIGLALNLIAVVMVLGIGIWGIFLAK